MPVREQAAQDRVPVRDRPGAQDRTDFQLRLMRQQEERRRQREIERQRERERRESPEFQQQQRVERQQRQVQTREQQIQEARQRLERQDRRRQEIRQSDWWRQLSAEERSSEIRKQDRARQLERARVQRAQAQLRQDQQVLRELERGRVAEVRDSPTIEQFLPRERRVREIPTAVERAQRERLQQQREQERTQRQERIQRLGLSITAADPRQRITDTLEPQPRRLNVPFRPVELTPAQQRLRGLVAVREFTREERMRPVATTRREEVARRIFTATEPILERAEFGGERLLGFLREGSAISRERARQVPGVGRVLPFVVDPVEELRTRGRASPITPIRFAAETVGAVQEGVVQSPVFTGRALRNIPVTALVATSPEERTRDRIAAEARRARRETIRSVDPRTPEGLAGALFLAVPITAVPFARARGQVRTVPRIDTRRPAQIRAQIVQQDIITRGVEAPTGPGGQRVILEITEPTAGIARFTGRPEVRTRIMQDFDGTTITTREAGRVREVITRSPGEDALVQDIIVPRRPARVREDLFDLGGRAPARVIRDRRLRLTDDSPLDLRQRDLPEAEAQLQQQITTPEGALLRIGRAADSAEFVRVPFDSQRRLEARVATQQRISELTFVSPRDFARAPFAQVVVDGRVVGVTATGPTVALREPPRVRVAEGVRDVPEFLTAEVPIDVFGTRFERVVSPIPQTRQIAERRTIIDIDGQLTPTPREPLIRLGDTDATFRLFALPVPVPTRPRPLERTPLDVPIRPTPDIFRRPVQIPRPTQRTAMISRPRIATRPLALQDSISDLREIPRTETFPRAVPTSRIDGRIVSRPRLTPRTRTLLTPRLTTVLTPALDTPTRPVPDRPRTPIRPPRRPPRPPTRPPVIITPPRPGTTITQERRRRRLRRRFGVTPSIVGIQLRRVTGQLARAPSPFAVRSGIGIR